MTYRVPKAVRPDFASLPSALRATSQQQLAALRSDVDMICGAAAATGEQWFNEIGPYIAEHMKTDAMSDLFANIRTTTLATIIARVYLAMDKTNVEHCETIDVMVKAYSESRAH